MRKTHAFILRFWQEVGEEHANEWRGVVIHVTSGEHVAVRSLEEAAQVVASYLASDEPSEERFYWEGE